MGRSAPVCTRALPIRAITAPIAVIIVRTGATTRTGATGVTGRDEILAPRLTSLGATQEQRPLDRVRWDPWEIAHLLFPARAPPRDARDQAARAANPVDTISKLPAASGFT